jgi:hypothetical protein
MGNRYFIFTLILGGIFFRSVPSSAEPTCDTDCLHIKQAVAIMAATMEGCDHAFPEAKGAYTQAFKNWNLLKYDVPGLDDVVAERTADIANARKEVASDFHSRRFEQEIQCQGYGGKLQNQVLFFPPETLNKFHRK